MSAGSFSRTTAGNRAYVASVSVRFRSKEQGARVKDRVKNGASLSFFRSLRASSPIWASEASRARTRERAAKQPPAVASLLACLSRVYFSRYPPNGELARRLIFSLSFHFWRGQNRKSRSSVFRCSDPKPENSELIRSLSRFSLKNLTKQAEEDAGDRILRVS